MLITTDTLLCAACGRPIGDAPAHIGPAPDGGQPWAMHRDLEDCVAATLPGVDVRWVRLAELEEATDA